MALPHVGDEERRRRIAVRHALAPAHRVGSPEATTRAMTVLHATEAATVHLSVAARTEGVLAADVDTALYDERSLVKQLAMRRTLFVLPRDLLPATWGSASARVATTYERRIVKAVRDAGLADDGEAWLRRARAATLSRLEAGPASTQELRESVPELDGQVQVSQSARWGGPVNVAPWVLTLLGARGAIMRAHNAGHWRLNRPTWALTDHWLGTTPAPTSEAEGYAELVRRWLWTFGPGTVDDLQWWLGSTKTAVRRALADVDAEEVTLDGGGSGWVLPGDHGTTDEVAPWAALLPTLDPTTMGWKQRDFYLEPDDRPFLFDTNGNAGNTAWCNGRVVGCWVQDPDGVVHLSLLHDVGAQAVRTLEAEAERLTRWVGGVVITNVYASAQMKLARLP